MLAAEKDCIHTQYDTGQGCRQRYDKDTVVDMAYCDWARHL